jgi:hypothetical protein
MLTKEHSKQLMHAHKFKQMFACQKPDGNCFLIQKSSAGNGIRAARDNNSVKCVL